MTGLTSLKKADAFYVIFSREFKQLCWADPITPWVVSAKTGQWAMGGTAAIYYSPGGGLATLDAGRGPL